MEYDPEHPAILNGRHRSVEFDEQLLSLLVQHGDAQLYFNHAWVGSVIFWKQKCCCLVLSDIQPAVLTCCSRRTGYVLHVLVCNDKAVDATSVRYDKQYISIRFSHQQPYRKVCNGGVRLKI